ncbi:UNVERIFIED_CONTAM: hypothetical protein HHA_314320 [Hammondia hammondi]|eukprot:XP_008883499.1 hypothetical protein HHA_314320 [Hammondia hammondi]
MPTLTPTSSAFPSPRSFNFPPRSCSSLSAPCRSSSSTDSARPVDHRHERDLLPSFSSTLLRGSVDCERGDREVEEEVSLCSSTSSSASAGHSALASFPTVSSPSASFLRDGNLRGSSKGDELNTSLADRAEKIFFSSRDSQEETRTSEGSRDTRACFSLDLAGGTRNALRVEREAVETEEETRASSLRVAEKTKGSAGNDKTFNRKTDIRIRRRVREIMKSMKKADTAKGRLKEEFERDEEIRKDPILLARQEEELRTLRLVDPLVRPIERRRYTVQWWPNFAREALPRVLASLPHVDLLVEVRDARFPSLTQLPIRPPAGGAKPRLIVLTHADRASEAGNAQWAKHFRFLHRLHAAEALDIEERNAWRHGGQSRPPHPGVSYRGDTTLREEEGEEKAEEEREGEEEEEEQEEEKVEDEDGESVFAGDVTGSEGPLVPPVAPATPVVFVNAQQGGACIVRVEKAARKIVKKWREYRRDLEVYRQRLKRLATEEPQQLANLGGEHVEGGREGEEGRRGSAGCSAKLQSRGSEGTLRAAKENVSHTVSSPRTPGGARSHLRTKRPLRLLIVGMPNTGKSALCNRLLGTKRARSYNYPGVTKVLLWYRRRGTFFQTNLHRLFDCVDTPGFLPPPSSSVLRPGRRGTVISSSSPASSSSASGRLSLSCGTRERNKEPSVRMRHSASRTEFFLRNHPVYEDDEAIRLLAACNKLPQSCLFTIEEASVALLNRMLSVWTKRPAYIPLLRLRERYGVDPLARGVNMSDLSGCEFLHRLAAARHHYCTGAASERVLTDFVKGYLGRMTLEVPPSREETLRRFHATRGGRVLSLSPLEKEEQEEERRRELARETIRRTRMRGSRDKKIPSDWECLVAKKEDSVFWNCTGSEATADPEELEDKRGGKDAEREGRESRSRLAFGVAEGGESAAERKEERRLNSTGDHRGTPGKMDRKRGRTEELTSKDVQRRVERETEHHGGDETVEAREHTQGQKKIALLLQNNEVLWSEGEGGREKMRQRGGVVERVSKDETKKSFQSLVRAFATEKQPFRNPSKGAHAADVLDERLRTQVEELTWETGAFEGW